MKLDRLKVELSIIDMKLRNSDLQSQLNGLYKSVLDGEVDSNNALEILRNVRGELAQLTHFVNDAILTARSYNG